MVAIEGCASVADSAGNLLCYTNASGVWDRQDRLLAGGSLGSSTAGTNAVQGALLLKHPGQPRQYLLFTVDEAQNQFAAGLRYAVVEMAANGQTGQVLLPALQRLTPVGYRVTEALTAVRHANGTDYWVIVHGHLNSEFLSYHLTAAGPDTVPVRSHVGSYHSFTNPGVPLRGSPDGRLLAAVVPAGGGTELLDFNNLTGQLSNARLVPGMPTGYGLEFSPDNTLLYLSGGGGLWQANLRSGAPTTLITYSSSGTLQRGPDGRIYIATYQLRSLDVITFPNVPGPGCGYQAATVSLVGRQSLFGLPNFPNQPPRPTRLVAPREVCAGTLATLSTEGLLASSPSVANWNFGDPAAGPANQAMGNPVSHQYTQPGTYTITLTLTGTAAGTVQRTRRIEVVAVPSLRLSPRDTLLCAETSVQLRASPQPAGTSYHWQDGSTGPTLLATQPGRYVLEVRNAAGCIARDSVLISTQACAFVIPNIITPNYDAQNDFFVLQGLVAADWSLRIYNRWGRQVYQVASYDNRWAATGQVAGLYYYLLENKLTGRRHKGWVEVVK
jgi:gliding motility-associated-like protein